MSKKKKMIEVPESVEEKFSMEEWNALSQDERDFFLETDRIEKSKKSVNVDGFVIWEPQKDKTTYLRFTGEPYLAVTPNGFKIYAKAKDILTGFEGVLDLSRGKVGGEVASHLLTVDGKLVGSKFAFSLYENGKKKNGDTKLSYSINISG